MAKVGRFSVVMIAVLTLVSAMITAGASAATASVDVDLDEEFVIYVPDAAETYDEAFETMAAARVSPGCGTGEKKDKIIKRWSRKSSAGVKPALLRCGTQATSGLRHINAHTTVSRAGTKEVYSGVMCIRAIRTGKVFRAYTLVVAVGASTNIITSYPTSGRSADSRC